MDDFDVVVDALQKHRDRLWDMINRNRKSEYASLNIMDDIRFYQIEQLDEAIMARKNKKEWQGLTDKPTKIFGPNLEELLNSAGFYRKKEWVGLTDEEIREGNKDSWVTRQAWESAAWWAEAKLKEKNT